jgi:hypothetical protein
MDVQGRLPDELRIESIASRLDETERDFRKKLMDVIISRGAAVNINAEAPVELRGWSWREMIEALSEKKAAILGDNGDVHFIYPVSALPTCHQVTLADGRRFSAMCAIDAIGSAFTFEQDVQVRSKCHTCNGPVEVEVRDGDIGRHEPEGIRILHVDLSKFDVWAGAA